jgi:hypothetical protein
MGRMICPPASTSKKVLNFIGFQAGWFVCVLGAAQGSGWLGPLFVAAFLALHLYFASDRRGELRVAAAAVGLGAVVDSIFGLTGVLVYESNPWPVAASPPWILAMWVNFGAGMRSSLSWMEGRYRLAAIVGAVGGPAAYLAAARLEAVSFGVAPSAALPGLAVAWGIAVPLLGFVAWREQRP